MSVSDACATPWILYVHIRSLVLDEAFLISVQLDFVR